MDSGAGPLDSSLLFAPSEGCEPRGVSSLGGRHGELGDRLIEERRIAIEGSLDINLSSRSGQVKANPLLGLMTLQIQERDLPVNKV